MENTMKLLIQYAVMFKLLGKTHTTPILKFYEKHGADHVKKWNKTVQ